MAKHEALGAFVGDWWAEGTSYGGDGQSPDTPHAGASPWRSTHRAEWYSGGFFVVQDERANGPFHTLSLLGWDRDDGRYFARTIENHGFCRDYTVTRDGARWIFSGPEERAVHAFSDDGRTQTIRWERRVGGAWLPLCDRVARRVE